MMPRQFWRVSWSIARLWDTPNDRIERSRNFTSAHAAAAQVRAVAMWVPTHADTPTVSRTCGAHANGDLKWEPVDIETGLPPLLPHVEARYAALEAVAKGDEVDPVMAAALRDDTPDD